MKKKKQKTSLAWEAPPGSLIWGVKAKKNFFVIDFVAGADLHV